MTGQLAGHFGVLAWLRPGAAHSQAGLTVGVCRVQFMRNALSVVPKRAHDAVAAIVRTIFAHPVHASAIAQLREVAAMLGAKFPQVAELLEESAEDVLAHLHFPLEHRRRLHSTNPLERLPGKSSAGSVSSGPSRRDTR